MKIPLLSLAGLLAAASLARADFVATVDAGRLRIDALNPLPSVDNSAPYSNGSLLLLIAPGSDGVFDNLGVTPGSFVAGDDFVLAASGFNHQGTGPDETFNAFSVLNLSVPAGEQIALRWFPSLTLAQYNASVQGQPSGAAPLAGSVFGTYNPRLYGNSTDNPDGGDAWLTPVAGGAITLNFFTLDTDGTQSPTEGYSPFVVGVVPEPSTPALLLGSAAALVGLRVIVSRRRRRA